MKRILFLMFFVCSLLQSQQLINVDQKPNPSATRKSGGWFPALGVTPAGFFYWDSLYVDYLKANKLNDYVPNNGVALDSLEFQNRLATSIVDTSRFVKKLDTLTYIETRHRTDSIIVAFTTALDLATIARTNVANHFLSKQTIDSLRLSNIDVGYVPYQNAYKLVNSLIITDGIHTRIGNNEETSMSSQTAQSTSDKLGGTTNIMIGQSFTGNGSLLTSYSLGIENYLDYCGANYLRAYLYAHDGTFGVSSVPTGGPLATSVDSLPPRALDNDDYNFSRWHFDSTFTLVNGTKYVLVIRYIGCEPGAGTGVNVGMKTSFTEGEGNASYSTDGTTWTYNVLRRMKYSVFGMAPNFPYFMVIGGNTQITGAVTLPNSNVVTGNVDSVSFNKGISLGIPLRVSDGGTGRTTGTTANALIATGSTAAGVQQTLASVGSSGQILRSAGNALPTWSTATYPATAGTSKNELQSDGTNWVSAAPDSAGLGVNLYGKVAVSDSSATPSGRGKYITPTMNLLNKLKTDSTANTGWLPFWWGGKYFQYTDTTAFKNQLLKNGDSTTLRNQFLKNADSTTLRNQFLKNGDSTTQRNYSNALYKAKTDSTGNTGYTPLWQLGQYWSKSVLDTNELITKLDTVNIARLGRKILGKSAPYFIAASNATDEEKLAADYVCTGTNDETVFQTVIDLIGSKLPTISYMGLNIALSSGNFYVTNSILDSVKTTIYGQGNNRTIIYKVSTNPIFLLNSYSFVPDVRFRGIKFQSQDQNMVGSAILDSSANELCLEDCEFRYFRKSPAITIAKKFAASNWNIVSHCWFNQDSVGIQIDSSRGSTYGQLVYHCQFYMDYSGYLAIRVKSGASIVNMDITENQFKDGGGVLIEGGTRYSILSNFFQMAYYPMANTYQPYLSFASRSSLTALATQVGNNTFENYASTYAIFVGANIDSINMMGNYFRSNTSTSPIYVTPGSNVHGAIQGNYPLAFNTQVSGATGYIDTLRALSLNNPYVPNMKTDSVYTQHFWGLGSNINAVNLNGVNQYMVKTSPDSTTTPVDTEMITNHGAEVNTTGWNAYNCTLTRATDAPVLYGTASFKVVQSTTTGRMWQNINLQPSTTYLVHLLVRFTTLSSGARMSIWECNTIGQSETNESILIPAENLVQDSTYTISTYYTTNATADRPSIALNPTGGSGNSTFRIDEFYVEKLDRFTILAWTKFTGTGWVAGVNRRADTSTAVKGFSLTFQNASTGTPAFTMSDSLTQSRAIWGSAINDGNWHLVCGRIHLSQLKISISVDGRDSIASTYTGVPIGQGDSLCIGRYGSYYGAEQIGEVRIIRNQLITNADLANYYRNGLPSFTTNEVSRYQWKPGTFLNDLVGRNSLTGNNVTEASNKTMAFYVVDPTLQTPYAARIDSFGRIVAAKITLDSMAYGSAYISFSVPDTVVFAGLNVQITLGKRHAFASVGTLKNTTVQDTSITVGVDGVYEVSYSMSDETVSGITNEYIHYGVYINDTYQVGTTTRDKMSGANDGNTSTLAPVLVTLHKNDIVKIKVLNATDATGSLSINGTYSVKRVE
jgi:hypothetical protein